MAAVVLAKLLRAGEGKTVRRLSAIADHIETLEDDYVDLTDAELRALTDTFKERYADGETLDDLLPEAFAVVREAARRTLGQFHYKVQLMGGAALHLGNIAEMKTGEGKTLVSTLPAYLNALTGDGVHIVTVNDYLAGRDADWMGRVHRFLGLIGRQDPVRACRRRSGGPAYGARHHLRHEQRVRLRLPARQHGLVPRGSASSAGTTTRSSTRSTPSSSTRPARR